MNIKRSLAVAVFIATAFVSVVAQPRPNTSPAQQPAATPAPQSTGTVPESKIALIYSNQFLDPKTGIAKFNTLMNTLNREFQPRQTELNQLQQRIQTSQDEINKIQAASQVVDQRSLQAKVDALEQLKKDYQRKGEDAEAAYQKRQGEIFAPLQEDIEKALGVFAKQRGINVIIDASRVPLVYAADSIDITRAFIADFNSKNPVTASVTPPE
ncbi:MAG TPA: OmpH family outer membrane protein [Pyrinomonadaceae bacterium]|nr:OmpH family outer membrane protein [Pyrinomonadaceae bacterium]